MAGFVYYLPGLGRDVTYEQLVAAGLGYAFERAGCFTPCEARGPDGGQGVIVANHDRVEAAGIGYKPDAQTWRVIPGRTAQVGMATAQRPRPDDLLRSEPLDGHLVRAGDGHNWLVPVARALSGEQEQLVYRNALPHGVRLNAAGVWEPGEPEQAYAELWRIACAWWDEWTAGGEEEGAQGSRGPGAEGPRGQGTEGVVRVAFDFNEALSAAATVLAVNYLVGPAEIDLLGLLSPRVARDVLCALIDWPTAVEWLKKKQQAASVPAG